MKTPEHYMKQALKEARKAEEQGEVPIGAVIVCDGKIIGRGHNKRKAKKRTADHAEMIAIRKANRKIGDWRLDGCDLYVTLEPCSMCAGAIQQARIAHVYYGAADPKAGALGSVYDMYAAKGLNHYPEVTGGILEAECGAILSGFFRELRKR